MSGPFDRRGQTIPCPLPRETPKNLPNREYYIEIKTEVTSLEHEQEAWNDLLEHSIEPNVFYSSDVVLPALQYIPPPGEMSYVIVKSRDRGVPQGSPLWCGFFPLYLYRQFRGMPILNLQLLKHDYCFLQTPLIRKDAASEVLSLFMEWLLYDSKASLLELTDQNGDGQYHCLLSNEINRRGLRPWIKNLYGRGILVRAANDDAFIRSSMSGSRIKHLRRLERRLFDEGPLVYDSLRPDGNLDQALDDFLEIQRSGWKGECGTAIACRPNDLAFFEQHANGFLLAEDFEFIFSGMQTRSLLPNVISSLRPVPSLSRLAT